MSCYNCGKDKEPTLAERLNKRVTLLRPRGPLDPPPTLDEYNQPINDLIDAGTLWAAIEPLQGNEYFAALRENAEVTTRIRIRYRDGIDRTMVIRYKDIEFEILYIIHPEFAKKELQLMCKERQ